MNKIMNNNRKLILILEKKVYLGKIVKVICKQRYVMLCRIDERNKLF